MRRRILEALCSLHMENPAGEVDAHDLVALLGVVDAEAFYEDLQHLYDEGYVEGTPVPFEHRGYLKRARISRKGVEAVDSPAEMDRLFPVDKPHEAAEAFVEALKESIRGADIPAEDKEAMLVDLGRFISNPRAAEAMAAALMKQRGV
jgi:hypothetical protein